MDAVPCLRVAGYDGRVASMARTGRPKAELAVTDEDRETLERWSRRAKSAQALALRSRIILACAGGLDNKAVAAELGVHPSTVGKWRVRFAERGLDGLCDEDRPGRPRTISDERVERVIVATLESKPADATHWSRRSMARKAGISKSSVGRIWTAFRIRPHLADTFKLSSDPMFIDKVHDVVGLYLSPPEHAVVLCVDEKTQIQALDRSQPVLPMMPGFPERSSNDYVRHGVTDLFAALNMADGTVITQFDQQHRSIEFRKFLARIDKNVPDGLDIHLICDNYATHKTPMIQDWLAARPRFTIHFIPTGSSWLNMVERWFSELTTRLLQRGVHKSVRALEKDITAWIATWNDNPRPYVWTKTADEILESLASYCRKVTGYIPANLIQPDENPTTPSATYAAD
jgi:transposase